MECLKAIQSQSRDIIAVCGERGLSLTCSIEDSEDSGVEYHVHDNPEEIKDILRAIQVLDALEPALSAKIAVDAVLIGAEVGSRGV